MQGYVRNCFHNLNMMDVLGQQISVAENCKSNKIGDCKEIFCNEIATANQFCEQIAVVSIRDDSLRSCPITLMQLVLESACRLVK